MEEKNPGTCIVKNNEGECFNCHTIVEVNETEIFQKNFICPACESVNEIEIRYEPQNFRKEGKCVIEGSEGLCFKCKISIEVSDEELTAGKFTCPECGVENNITIKNEELKKWLPAIPITLALITVYLFGRIGDIVSFKEQMIVASPTYKTFFLDIIVVIRIGLLLSLIFVMYSYFKKRKSLMQSFNFYVILLIVSTAASTFLLYYSLYIYYETSTIISSAASVDWDIINETVDVLGKNKLQTIQDSIFTIIFLILYQFGGNYYFSRVDIE